MPRPSKKAAKPPPSESGSEDDHDDRDLSDVEEPPTIDPYEVLGLERDATADQVKTAYRKAALKNHPDKVPTDQKDSATSTFQRIALAYAILSSPHRRSLYDTTGSTSETLSQSSPDFSWAEYYRTCFFESISPSTIAAFSASYKFSDEERADVLAAYTDYEGDMDGVYESVMLSDVLEDDERYRKWIDEAIERGEVEGYPAYKKETKKKRVARVKAARGEAREAEELARELGVYDKLNGGSKGGKGGKGKKDDDGGDGEGALAALILARQKSRGDMFDQLAEKYGAKPKGKKRKAEEEPEIDEEEFQRIQAGLGKPGGSGSASGGAKAKQAKWPKMRKA
ncbi:hypothetical protein B0T20DRAFT_404112 [Sordaria brevicollis]|uniref:J domain-containing protein n=1 Tax=Sordaria brevicollis TaxID=83679 RepID=A0AAE0PLW3_SORBR|nr:hypothetical protein B0T20DRAFT_404112 [Sordaria brevicollis]